MKLALFYYHCFILFSEQLCELVEEEDLELVTALVQWDFEDEMEDEDDEHGKFDFFVPGSNVTPGGSLISGREFISIFR